VVLHRWRPSSISAKPKKKDVVRGRDRAHDLLVPGKYRALKNGAIFPLHTASAASTASVGVPGVFVVLPGVYMLSIQVAIEAGAGALKGQNDAKPTGADVATDTAGATEGIAQVGFCRSSVDPATTAATPIAGAGTVATSFRAPGHPLTLECSCIQSIAARPDLLFNMVALHYFGPRA